jgi:hypothetical protein
MRMVKSLLPALLIASLFSTLAYAQTPDRISGPIDSSRMVPLFGNIQGPSRPGSDLGRADGGRLIEGISLDFRLSPAQQKDLDQFLAQLGDRSSPNYHKYLKIPQYARRFGMSQNDVDKIVAWIEAQGFTNIKVSPTRNQISFDGTVAQIESAFALEMHHYLVDGEVHLANAMNPSLPAALAGAVQHVGHLHDFAPKPRLKVKPNLTSYISGNHYLSPADFATIYDLTALYSANATGSNQKIAIVGQSTVLPADLSNFRSAAGLPATPTVNMMLIEGTATRCSGDEGESDLDLEWSGGVAKGAQITFIYAGLGAGDSCGGARRDSVWDALEFALTGSATQGTTGSPVAPFVSTSYGLCEQQMQAGDPGFAATIQGWVQTGLGLGVTLVSASGDSGAADCDPSNSTSATQGLAVDVPASIPDVTGAGGNEFTGDAAGTVTGNQAGADQPYWSGSGAGTDTISSALEYIPETAWNDTIANIAAGGGLAASGGGASTLFARPTWQTGTGVPAGTQRLVPDISITASADHDGYLFCSEDDQQTGGIVSTCTDGFRTGAGGTFTIVGGTSAAAPTFTAIMALVNQYLGNTPPTGLTNGLVPVNQTLYTLYPNNATSKAFHDVTTGSNIVPCTSPSPNCPTGTTDFGFNAGVGYDQVTGLGSVDGFNLAQAWAATLAGFTLAPSPASVTAVAGQNTGSATITITPQNGFTGNVTFTCSAGLPSGATCVFTTINATSSSLVIQTSANMAAASNIAVTVKGSSGAVSSTTTVNLTITATTMSFSVNSSLTGTLSVAQGATTSAVNLTVTSTSTPSFIVTSGTSTSTALPLSYSCSGLPSESTCNFSPGSPSSSASVSFTIKTTAPTAELRRPLDGGARIFYAVLLPGLFGIMFTVGSRKRSLRGMRLLGLMVVLGFSTLWLSSCSGSSGSGNSNPGTPKGTSTVTLNATTGGTAPIASSVTFQFTVD